MFMDVKCIVAIVERGKADKIVEGAKRRGPKVRLSSTEEGPVNQRLLDFLTFASKPLRRLY